MYFCLMLAKLFKAFVGDKSANDIKEVQPVVDRVKEIEPSLAGLSADDLRAKSAYLRSCIQDHVAGELQQIKEAADVLSGKRLSRKEMRPLFARFSVQQRKDNKNIPLPELPST